MNYIKSIICIFLTVGFLYACGEKNSELIFESSKKTRVILDTDANNELDDQHAIAYMLLSGDTFDVVGITVNRTKNGGKLSEHYEEAVRIVDLCDLKERIKVLKGADKTFNEIKTELNNPTYDGREAVEFIIEHAKINTQDKLVLLPIGKLTNIALALYKDPTIAENVRIVWLGSNYPDPGEYNQENDLSALEYMLDLDIEFEIVTVRYGKPSGTAAVYSTTAEVEKYMSGKGPQISEQIIGRHGNSFNCFGDYAVDLFQNAKMYGEPPHRSLFDMAAVAIVKNPTWADKKEIPAPSLIEGKWEDRPNNTNTIIIWENFNKKEIMKDFFNSIENYVLFK